jgi:hypothetical protein
MIDLANWRICGQYNTIPDTIQGLKMISELEKNSKNSYVISRIAELYYIGVGELLKKDDNKAFELLQTVENKEEPQYLWLMGVFYSNGTEVIDIDGNKAISYFEKAFENGRIGARQLGFINYYGYANIEKNIDKAIEWYKKGVEIGSTSCMLQLVYIYISEDSILQKYHNEKEALSLVRKAIRLGSGTACDELGRWYSEGFIVEKDDVKAFENFVKADLYGSSNGSLNLGVCYIAGRGCEQDSKKAEQLWQKAANMGSQVAAMHLATSYLNGVLDNSSEKYVFYLEKAAKLGSPEAYYELATNYYYALHGYKKDVYQAFVYTKKAADEGLVDACETVASMYEEGVGCEKNLQKAREYRSKKYL